MSAFYQKSRHFCTLFDANEFPINFGEHRRVVGHLFDSPSHISGGESEQVGIAGKIYFLLGHRSDDFVEAFGDFGFLGLVHWKRMVVEFL